ncbi:unnamed protein product [Nezara viridula]|uniref:Uncharacterized protein n=1 Tax=Nezara viridula TaxID=85310 RepID=A0A9P0E0Q5_NEZVI|nr:unnamed protein product [Nezara viridula]
MGTTSTPNYGSSILPLLEYGVRTSLGTALDLHPPGRRSPIQLPTRSALSSAISANPRCPAVGDLEEASQRESQDYQWHLFESSWPEDVQVKPPITGAGTRGLDQISSVKRSFPTGGKSTQRYQMYRTRRISRSRVASLVVCDVPLAHVVRQ